MTFQVGMVGTNGVLIASDTLEMKTARSQSVADVRYTESSTKFKINHAKGLVIACAVNLEVARRVADDLILQMQPSDWDSPDEKALDIANKVLKESTERRSAFQCTIAVRRETLSLYQLHAGMVGLQEGARFEPKPHTAFAGDMVNAAVFWRERYYSSWDGFRPIEQLIPLAAQIVYFAGKLSRGHIDGLELVVCSANGIVPLKTKQIEELLSKAATIDRQLSDSLFQEFAYAPNVIG